MGRDHAQLDGLNGRRHLPSVKSKAKAIVDMTLDNNKNNNNKNNTYNNNWNNNKYNNINKSWPKVKCFVGNC